MPFMTPRADRSISVRSLPFFLIHALAVAGVVWLGWSWWGFLLAVALYYVRMFGVTAGYHRLFSHRAFKTSRAMQLFFALLATSSAQKGVLWWASHHRLHHKNSDLEGDVHSAKLDGFYWSHVGWILSEKYEATEQSRVHDLAKYPELVWLERWHLVPPTVLGVGLWLVGGWWALCWGLFVSTVMLWHGTFTINSLSHLWGKRRYATTDDSRNNFWLALITMGEGWHNNHHRYQRAANQGFYWWEIDLTYYVLRAMARLGLVWDLHAPPSAVLAEGAQADGRTVTPAAQPEAVAATTTRSRLETTTPPGRSTVTANILGLDTGTLAVMGMTTSPVAVSTSKTPPSTG